MRTVTVQELKTKIDSGEPVILIDVREPSEYAEFNIGGTLLPLGDIMNMQLGPLEDKKDEEIFVHCRSGMRSQQACMFLETMGYTNVVNVLGGAMAYRDNFG